MTAGIGRKYRGEPSRPIPVWNGIQDHEADIGEAIWTYFWCLDRITHEANGVGHVLGEAPIKIRDIVKGRPRSYSSVQRDLDRLESKYLRLKRTPYGLIIHVVNSRKFGIWAPSERSVKDGNSLAERSVKADKSQGQRFVKNDEEIGQKCPERFVKNDKNKEDAAVYATETQQQQTATAGLHPAWKALGLTEAIGNVMFQGDWEAWYSAHPPNGKTASQVAEDFIQHRQRLGQKAPRAFFEAKHRTEEQESNAVVPIVSSYGPRRPAVQL